MSKKEYSQQEIIKEMREVHSPYTKNNKSPSQGEMIKDIGTWDCKVCPPLKKKPKVNGKIRKYADLIY